MENMKCWIVYSLVLAVAAFTVVESNCGCRIPFNVVGCRKDIRGDRALPEILINERDRTSSKYNGFDVNWYDWDNYLPAFACRCAEAAMKKGYKYFGLQYWGECWSGPSPAVDQTYEKHGKGQACYGPGYEKCTPSFTTCVGDHNNNFVYEIEPYICPVKFERMGCYKDAHRPLNDYILTDRDYNHPAFSGQFIDWNNFETYLPDLSCRCAQKAATKGYNTFGIQYYGECWSGKKADEKYFTDGVSSSCVNQCYKPCKNFDRFCTGKGFTNFVYRITTEVCEIDYKVLGCFKEDTDERALDVLIIDDDSPESSAFMGLVSTDFDNWEEYIEGLICRCARKIKERGYTVFSIQNGGECWSGSSAHTWYNNSGKSNECYYDETSPCTSEKICTGREGTSFVYKLD